MNDIDFLLLVCKVNDISLLTLLFIRRTLAKSAGLIAYRKGGKGAIGNGYLWQRFSGKALKGESGVSPESLPIFFEGFLYV